MNTASLRLLPPCQRGFQCWGMLEWIKWIFYHENTTIHFSSVFLYIQTWDAEGSWLFLKDSKATLYLKKNGRESEKSFLKTVNTRKWCMIVSPSQSPSLKWGPSVQQGNQGRRQSVYSDCVSFCSQNSVVISTFSSGPKTNFLVKSKQTEFHQFKEAQLCLPATISQLNTWTSFSLAMSLVEIIIHPFLIYGVFRKRRVSSKPCRHSAGLCQMGVVSTSFTLGSLNGTCRMWRPNTEDW